MNSSAMRQQASCAKLLLVTIASLAGVAGAAAVVLYLGNQPLWWQGYKAGIVIGGITALASLPPLLVGLRWGLMALVVACFAAVLLRTFACMVALVIAIRLLGYPLLPTSILAAAFYVTLLAAETTYLSVTHWSA